MDTRLKVAVLILVLLLLVACAMGPVMQPWNPPPEGGQPPTVTPEPMATGGAVQ